MRILLISGSTRRGSGNTAALRTVQAMAPDGLITDPPIRAALGAALTALAEHARG
jgi:NAD(P)H-dependent FMN reductase